MRNSRCSRRPVRALCQARPLAQYRPVKKTMPFRLQRRELEGLGVALPAARKDVERRARGRGEAPEEEAVLGGIEAAVAGSRACCRRETRIQPTAVAKSLLLNGALAALLPGSADEASAQCRQPRIPGRLVGWR